VLFSLTYISSSRELFSRQQLEEMAVQSGAKNARLRITGMLLYKDSSFMQVLEGEKSEVLQLYATIAVDRRHSGVITLLQGDIDKREFPRWSMGFQHLDQSLRYAMSDCAEDLRATIATNRSMGAPSQAVKLISIFAGLRE
jgi:Sensors of blue-light using FAD